MSSALGYCRRDAEERGEFLDRAISFPAEEQDLAIGWSQCVERPEKEIDFLVGRVGCPGATELVT